MSETLVDARGLRCPWPALRLARAMREGGASARVRIVTDDPSAPREIAALAAEQDWAIELLPSVESADAAVFLVRCRPPGVNTLFTSSR